MVAKDLRVDNCEIFSLQKSSFTKKKKGESNMIEGLYEAHLSVKNLDISMDFYKKIGLKLAWRDEDTAFFWIEENKSWVGLWEGKEYQTPSLH